MKLMAPIENIIAENALMTLMFSSQVIFLNCDTLMISDGDKTGQLRPTLPYLGSSPKRPLSNPSYTQFIIIIIIMVYLVKWS